MDCVHSETEYMNKYKSNVANIHLDQFEWNEIYKMRDRLVNLFYLYFFFCCGL